MMNHTMPALEEAGKRLLDMSLGLDMGLLDIVVKAMCAGDEMHPKVAQSVPTRLKENSNSSIKVNAIQQCSSNRVALQILENFIRTRWIALPRDQADRIKTFIMDLIIKTSSDSHLAEQENLYLTQLNMVLVQILKREWPKRWPTFISDIVGASKTNESLCRNSMIILKLLNKELFNFSSGQLTHAKTKYLKETMCHEFEKIFQLCTFVMETTSNENLVQSTLETLLPFLSWIPVQYVFNTTLIDMLTSRFLPEPRFQDITLQCLIEIAMKTSDQETTLNNVEIVDFDSSELITCDWYILADSVLKNFCECLLDDSLDSNKPLVEPEAEEEADSSSLTRDQQLVLVRSCLSDVIYAMHFLGLWCAKKTVQLYITEFSRLLHGEPLIGDLISALVTMLNILYGRLEELSIHIGDVVMTGSSAQLKSLLGYIKEFKPVSANIPWPICIIHVQRRIIAKVMALWLDKVAKRSEEYSFMTPNYTVGSIRKNRNHMAIDNFDLHHETALRDFRFGKCNTLVTTAISEHYSIVPKCNLIVSFDPPTCFSGFMRAKSNCRYESSKYVIMLSTKFEKKSNERIWNYIRMESILSSSTKKVDEQEERVLMESLEKKYEPYPAKSDSKSPATIWRGVNIINKYCSKLPRDSFTKLLPEWNIRTVSEDESSSGKYFCEIRLPINSPVRQKIIGPVAPTKNIAIKLAAFTACKELHRRGELDDNMMPITKESMKTINPLTKTKVSSTAARPSRKGGHTKGRSIGSIKYRQYYQKRIAEVFSGPVIREGTPCYLYQFKMELTCPIPDEQNRRGRRIIDPSETSRNYAIVCSRELPKICSFPVFTRSGEVLISIVLVKGKFELNSSQITALRTFHEYTFSKVLRLNKYPTIYDPDGSPFTVLLAPVIEETFNETEIDWDFVERIVNHTGDSHQPSAKDRRAFKFNKDDYIDAVVIPWYRLTDRQQFAYYVADICTDLTPKSPFPDKSSGFKTFVEYYKSKYDIEIFNTDQPVLDVDHTSARLNLLTPRYVNRKGRTLPSSTAKTRKESRESLIQKQLLIPELCSIHPFPASFWRKAVCLPCIFYRLNSILLAEELRRKISNETRVGSVEPEENFQWPALSFGWSLKDVVNIKANESWDSLYDSPKNSKGTSDLKRSYKNCKNFRKLKQKVRELYLPGIKTAMAHQQSSKLESLIHILKEQGRQELHQVKMLREVGSDQWLVDALDKIFEDTIKVAPEKVDASWDDWFNVLRELNMRVDTALNNDPDLFKDEGVEVITVDDIETSPNTQPTFGELLPDREVHRSWPAEDWKKIKFDPTRYEISSDGPGPSVILQALTMSNASDGINLERLETVGDSFLKYSITAYLFCMHPTMHEGKLSYLRSTEISNANLHKLGMSKNLGEIMSATKFEPNDNWLAPGYSVAEGATYEDTCDYNKKREIDRALAEVPYDLLLQHSIPDKSIADCVEALIGAYLTASGSRAALLFMRWLGLNVIPESFDLNKDLEQGAEENTIWRWLETPPSPLICCPPTCDPDAPEAELFNLNRIREEALEELNHLYYVNCLERFEDEIQYTFRDKAYLVQAFTHNSFYENHVTDCHQRLEFLGDALLDYLITRYLFEDPQGHSPGTLTDLRSALVNNTFFASLAVKYKFHEYLQFTSDELFHVIDKFVKKFKFDNKHSINKGYTLLISEGESEYAEDIEVPKALGDVFESVAGAIYLDSGMSLDQVWQVYFKMMKPEIEYFSKNVPKSPIRELLESMPQNVRFSPSELAPDRKHRVIAEVFGLGRFIGVGRSKHSAKSTAAKRALRMLKLRKRDQDKAVPVRSEHLPIVNIMDTSYSQVSQGLSDAPLCTSDGSYVLMLPATFEIGFYDKQFEGSMQELKGDSDDYDEEEDEQEDEDDDEEGQDDHYEKDAGQEDEDDEDEDEEDGQEDDDDDYDGYSGHQTW